MRFLLVAVNAKYIHSNPAVYSLRAYAQRSGFGPSSRENGQPEAVAEAVLAEYTINQPFWEILADLYGKKPDAVGFSCYIWNRGMVFDLIRELSKVLPRVPVWLGGPEVSYDPEATLSALPSAAGVMIGEGEETFRELIELYADALPSAPEFSAESAGISVKAPDSSEETPAWPLPDQICGIAYRTQPGGVVRRTPGRQAVALDEIPFFYGEQNGITDFQDRIIYYESSRGCPFSCSYCLSSIDKRLRFRSMELVKKELQFFLDHEVPQVKFVDRTFNCRKDHAMEIWKYLAEHDNQKTNFHFEIAADLITPEELELFRRMRPGLIQLEIGVQSTNLDTIREIHRKMDFEKVSFVVREIQKGRNIHQHLDLIAGLPFEDYDSFRRSFADVYRLKPQQLQLGFLKVLSGSYMAEHTADYQCLYQEEEPYEVLSTRWLPYEDVLRLKSVEEMVEVYYNSGQFHCLLGLAECLYENMFDFFAELGQFYEAGGYEGLSHTRVRRYEILLEFLMKKKKVERKVCEALALIDLYARENLKSRPAFAPDLTEQKEMVRRFYQREEQEHRYLKHYDGYQWKQLMRMTHLEVFPAAPQGTEGEKVLLFDYSRRDPLTGNAKILRIDMDEYFREYKK